MNFKAHDFPQVYEDLGIDLSLLGCIMLELDASDIDGLVKAVISDHDLYYANDQKRFWIKGLVTNKAHVTLLYGLLRTGLEMQKHVYRVLEATEHTKPEWWPRKIEIDHVGYFDSPYSDEPYYCIVAHLKTDGGLQEANERLKMLPHLNTFPGYKAHATLAYIKRDVSLRDRVLNELDHQLTGKILKPGAIDFGGNK